MDKSYVSGGQSVYVFGIDPTQRIAVDSTKKLAVTAEAVAGFPLALITGTEMLDTAPGATGGMFYGASSSNINRFAGRVSLENWTALRANAEMIGRYTVRPSVFLDSNQNEVTAQPFSTNTGGAYTVTVADVGKALNAAVVTVADAADAFDGVLMMKWTLGSPTLGCSNIGRIVAVRDNGEVEIWLNGSTPTVA